VRCDQAGRIHEIAGADRTTRDPSGRRWLDGDHDSVTPVTDRFGGSDVDLDENALTGAHLGGMNDALDRAGRYPGQASGTTRVVERASVLGNVGNPVLELHENVVAMIDADSVSSAEVLVDPHTHLAAER
jgi:hypothetical protein